MTQVPVRTAQELERKYLNSLYKIEKTSAGIEKVENELTKFVAITTEDLEFLQDQVDGNISTWFYSGVPTLSNLPASNWTTDTVKKEHLGDLYYNQATGIAYRFAYSLTEGYYWLQLSDNSIAQALAVANAAKDTADNKRRVFVTQPTPPYDVGDLWVKENKDIYRCQTAKSSGSYASSDWIIATNYGSQVVVKRNTSGGLVTSELTQDSSEGTEFKITSGNINLSATDVINLLAGGTINLTGKNIAINSSNFSVTKDGVITANSGNIAGWAINSNCFSKIITDNSTYQYSLELRTDRNPNEGAILVYDAMNNRYNFYVSSSGALYARSADITGAINSGSTITGSTISGGSISITKGSYYFNMGVSTGNPNCSGLNVGGNGINFSNNNVGLNSSSGTITAGATFQASNFVQTTYNDNILYGNLYVYSNLKTNLITPGGNLGISTGGASVSPGSYAIYMRTSAGNITLDATNNGANTGYYVYARGGSLANDKVKTDKGSASSKNTKTNIKKFENDDYKEALELLKDMDIYSYDYKYNLYDKEKQYGFIIDEIEKQENYDKFFDFRNEQARVNGKKIDFNLDDNEDWETITVKKYNTDTLDKYLLTCIKALQQKIDILEEKINK